MNAAHETIKNSVRITDASRPGAIPLARPAWVPDELFPFTSRWIEVNGARLHYVDEGTGPVVLMVPGTPMWSFMYRHPIQSLSDQFRCISVDLPGLGLSDAPLFPRKAFSVNADWLQAFVRALDLRDFTLVVHAGAGPSALEMAARESDRTHSLVISNSYVSPPDQGPLRPMVRIITSSLFGFINVNFNFLPFLATIIGRRTGRFSAAEKTAILGPYRERRKREHLQNLAYSLRSQRSFLEKLPERLSVFRQTPTLFLFGGKDQFFKAGMLQEWKRVLPNNKVVILERSGHFINEDEPERYSAELRSWLWEN